MSYFGLPGSRPEFFKQGFKWGVEGNGKNIGRGEGKQEGEGKKVNKCRVLKPVMAADE